MALRCFAQFLFFSIALGDGHDWTPPQSEWEAQHPSPLPGGQPGHGHGGNPKGWPYGRPPAASGSSVTSPCPEFTTSAAQPLTSSAPQQMSSVNTGPTATLGCGVVIGTTTSLPAATATVNKFLGIPFAQSPPQRFGMPQAAGSCNVNATAWKPACIQQFVGTQVVRDFTEYVFNNPAPEESEDCLYLNVYAPSSPAPAGGRSVMFWIYGGALEFGNAGQIYYDGSYFAAYEDVIIVTTNYRTNVSGLELYRGITD